MSKKRLVVILRKANYVENGTGYSRLLRRKFNQFELEVSSDSDFTYYK